MASLVPAGIRSRPARGSVVVGVESSTWFAGIPTPAAMKNAPDVTDPRFFRAESSRGRLAVRPKGSGPTLSQWPTSALSYICIVMVTAQKSIDAFCSHSGARPTYFPALRCRAAPPPGLLSPGWVFDVMRRSAPFHRTSFSCTSSALLYVSPPLWAVKPTGCRAQAKGLHPRGIGGKTDGLRAVKGPG